MSSSILSTSSRALRQSSRQVSCAACQSTRLSHSLVEVELLKTVPGLGAQGERKAVSRGWARTLYPSQALYVVSGKPVSATRDILKKELRAQASRNKVLAQAIEESERRAKEAEEAARAAFVPENSQPSLDSQSIHREVEETLFASLSSLNPLIFSRRLIHPSAASTTSNEIFGSVQPADVVAALREQGIVVDEHNVEVEEKEGVVHGRVKEVGKFAFEVKLKHIGETVSVPIEVVGEA